MIDKLGVVARGAERRQRCGAAFSAPANISPSLAAVCAAHFNEASLR